MKPSKNNRCGKFKAALSSRRSISQPNAGHWPEPFQDLG
jgi:hypothetical protein